MSIVEYQINPKGKCITCKDYIFNNHNWLNGKCDSETTRVKNKNRNYNDRMCFSSRYDKNFNIAIKLGRRVESGSDEKCRNCDSFRPFISDIFNEACDWGGCLKNTEDEQGNIIGFSVDVDGGNSCPDFKKYQE